MHHILSAVKVSHIFRAPYLFRPTGKWRSHIILVGQAILHITKAEFRGSAFMLDAFASARRTPEAIDRKNDVICMQRYRSVHESSSFQQFCLKLRAVSFELSLTSMFFQRKNPKEDANPMEQGSFLFLLVSSDSVTQK